MFGRTLIRWKHILRNTKNNAKYKTTTYGAPVLQIGTKQGNRYRFPFDPISYLDNGAITVNKFNINPHSYSNYELNYLFILY